MNKILITGVNGLIGSHLAQLLTREGFEVTGVGRKNTPVVPLARYAPGDLLDYNWASQLIRSGGFDAVFHLAGLSSVRQSLQEPRTCYDANCTGTLHLLEAIRINSPKTTILLASSAEVYAHSPDTLRESSTLAPKSTYAVTKQILEELVELYSRLYGLHTVALRFFYSIGPSFAGTLPPNIPSGLAYRIAQLEHKGTTEPLRVGTLSQAKDFIDIRDIIAACSALLIDGHFGKVYNICSGTPHSFQEIVDTLQQMTSVAVPIEFDAQFIRPFEPEYICGSHELITRDTGWQPQYDILKDTLPNLLDFWRKEFRSKQHC